MSLTPFDPLFFTMIASFAIGFEMGNIFSRIIGDKKWKIKN